MFLIVGIGISNIIVHSFLFSTIREYAEGKNEYIGKMLNCMMCTGFWVGILLWIFNVGLFAGYNLIAPIAAGATISLFSSFYDLVTDFIANRIYVEEESVE
jgi:hypothetical protein